MNWVRRLVGALTCLSPLEPQAAELWYHGHNDLEAGLLAASRRAVLSTMIGERDYWGKRYGESALRLLIGYGFHIVNLNSIELVVHEDNARARRCYEKVGFQAVGRERQAGILRDRKLDGLVMDLFAEEFSGPSPVSF